MGRTVSRRKARPGRDLITKREGSPYWQLDFSIDGRRFRDSLRTGEESLACELALKRHSEELRRIKLGEEPTVEMTLNEAAARMWLEVYQHQRSTKSNRSKLRILLSHFGDDMRLSELSETRVANFVRERAEAGISAGTINVDLGHLSSLCKRARNVWKVSVGVWTYSAHSLKYHKHREIFLTMEEAHDLLRNMVPHFRGPTMLALMTGLRRANVVRLQWEDVSLDVGRIVMIVKGGKRQVLNLIPEAVDLLRRMEPEQAKRKGPVFYYGNPNIACRCSACHDKRFVGIGMKHGVNAFKLAAKRIGKPHLRFHDLRHTVASWMLHKGYSLKVVQETLAHSRISTTERYAHLEGNQVRDAMVDSLSLKVPPVASLTHKAKASGK